MKDGRPSRICDIRYFYGEHRFRSSYLEAYHDVWAFGRRLAFQLNGEGVSLGAYTALYILFTHSLKPGEIRITDDGGDWWQRYTYVGMVPDFPGGSDTAEIAMRETVSAIKAIRPDLGSVIGEADRIVSAHGNDLRFLIKTRETARFIVNMSFSVSMWREPSWLFLSLTEKENGVYREAPPIALDCYTSALGLANAIKVTGLGHAAPPDAPLAAWVSSDWHGGSLNKALVNFVPSKPPIMSKLVKPRG